MSRGQSTVRMSTEILSTIFVWYFSFLFLLHVSTNRVMRDIAEAAKQSKAKTGKDRAEYSFFGGGSGQIIRPNQRHIHPIVRPMSAHFHSCIDGDADQDRDHLLNASPPNALPWLLARVQWEGTGIQRPRRPLPGPTNRPYEKLRHLNRPSLQWSGT